MSGTFSKTHGASDKSAAGIIATATFFAPLIVTSPFKGVPPVITYLFKKSTSFFTFISIFKIPKNLHF